jgi:hypothetical protein
MQCGQTARKIKRKREETTKARGNPEREEGRGLANPPNRFLRGYRFVHTICTKDENLLSTLV